jgi:flagellin
MGISVNTNLRTLRALKEQSGVSLESSLERLSTGLRINHAKDDAAGLSISQRMKAKQNQLQVQIDQNHQSISLFQTAEGALQQVDNLLQRMREISIQSMNFSNGYEDRSLLQMEITQIKDEIKNISENTSFNGMKLLDGSFVQKTSDYAKLSANQGVGITQVNHKELGGLVRLDSKVGVLVSSISFDAGMSTSAIGQNGMDLIINGVKIRKTTAEDDTLSSDLLEGNGFAIDQIASKAARTASAIAKAKAINQSTAFTGVKAIVGATRTDDSYMLVDKDQSQRGLNGNNVFDLSYDDIQNYALGSHGPIKAVTLTQDQSMIINGVFYNDLNVKDGDSDSTLRDAINSNYEKTGIKAEVNQKGELVLIAEDGRNIAVHYRDGSGKYLASLEDQIGLGSGADEFDTFDSILVYGGKISLVSDEAIEITNQKDYNTTISDLLGGLSTANQIDSFTQSNDGDVLYFNQRINEIQSLSVSSIESSRVSVDSIDQALFQVSEMRAKIGAYQSEVESNISNLMVQKENNTLAVGRIQDADIAQEATVLAKAQIIQESSTSMLIKANLSITNVLKLVNQEV